MTQEESKEIEVLMQKYLTLVAIWILCLGRNHENKGVMAMAYGAMKKSLEKRLFVV